MQRPLAVVVLFVVLAAVLGGLWYLFGGEPAPPPPAPGPVATDTDTDAAAAAIGATTANADLPRAQRQVVAVEAGSLLDDPDYVAGLTGWKGRVVDHAKNPVADCGVRLYRGAMDSVLRDGLDLFADQSAFEPDYVAGETRTAADGTFVISRVRPRGFFLLFAGIGTDAPTHQVVTRLPSPGEVVDLGDVVLPHAGVIVGTVVDDNGEPLAGADVHAADLPGSLAAFFPLERFDPKGAVLVREPNVPMTVVEMPPWVETAYAQLPIPSAVTGADGAFRLVGVVPGSNLLATTRAGYLSELRPSIQVRPGQVKDVGRIKLRRGEELVGRVLDSLGKPVAGAELLAGSTIALAPVDLARRIEPSNDEGWFSAQGFAPGRVTVAARRGEGHPWVLAEPQSIAGEVLVTLPATHAVTVRVLLADGEPAKEARLRVLQGRPDRGAAEMHMLGFAPPIDLARRQQTLADGQWRIDNLQPDHYTIVADAPGHAQAFAGVELKEGDAEVELRLTAPDVFRVAVVDHEDQPVRNAAIYAEARGDRLVRMPVQCGRTDAEGRIEIDELRADSLRVSAEHPRWGTVHGEVERGQEVVLRMQQPATLRGVLYENGTPPTPGEYTVVVMHRRGSGPRGPLETVPGLLTPGVDGTFEIAALQPGSYRLSAIDSLDTLRSPGGIMAMAQNAFLMRDIDDVEVELLPGQTQEVVIEVGEKPIEGPTATLAGSLTVNGRLGTGYGITAYANGRRFSARIDERGRFDFGIVPAGDIWVGVQSNGENGVFFGAGGGQLWTATVSLKEAEARELTIDVQTSSIRGICVRPDGEPAAGVFVQVRGKLQSATGEGGDVWLGSPTDANGRFAFDEVAAGIYSFSVRSGRGDGDDGLRGEREGVEVVGGLPLQNLRIELQAALVVKGRVDLAQFGDDKPRRCWLQFERVADDGEGQTHWSGTNRDDGSFSTDDLRPGRYRVRMRANFTGDRETEAYECGEIDVPPTGLTDLVLRPGARVP